MKTSHTVLEDLRQRHLGEFVTPMKISHTVLQEHRPGLAGHDIGVTPMKTSHTVPERAEHGSGVVRHYVSHE